MKEALAPFLLAVMPLLISCDLIRILKYQETKWPTFPELTLAFGLGPSNMGEQQYQLEQSLPCSFNKVLNVIAPFSPALNCSLDLRVYGKSQSKGDYMR